MVTVQICVGSSCYLRGVPKVIDKFQELSAFHGLLDRITLQGTFCMDQCCKGGVSMRIGENLLTGVRCEDIPELFRSKIIPAITG
jgi:NADH:ubiquinone oxidoreductase subunit E